jgi:hypothetical protein
MMANDKRKGWAAAVRDHRLAELGIGPVTIASVRPILKHFAAHDSGEITVGRLVELMNEAGFCVRRVV